MPVTRRRIPPTDGLPWRLSLTFEANSLSLVGAAAGLLVVTGPPCFFVIVMCLVDQVSI
jgi:hypothetical protein